MGEPLLTLWVNGQNTFFLVDTGASYSTMQHVPQHLLSLEAVTVLGYEAQPTKNQLTIPLRVELGHLIFQHQFSALSIFWRETSYDK